MPTGLGSQSWSQLSWTLISPLIFRLFYSSCPHISPTLSPPPTPPPTPPPSEARATLVIITGGLGGIQTWFFHPWGLRGGRTLERHEHLVSQYLSLVSFQGTPPPQSHSLGMPKVFYYFLLSHFPTSRVLSHRYYPPLPHEVTLRPITVCDWVAGGVTPFSLLFRSAEAWGNWMVCSS